MTSPSTTNRRRVIVNTDAANEADDQFAIVHALLSPSLDVRGLIGAHFGEGRSTQSQKDSRIEIDRLIDLLGGSDVIVADGAPHALPDETTPVDSPGARLIIEEAHSTPDVPPGSRTDEPLYIAFLGPLTDMASALLLDPSIADRSIVVIWIGGPAYGDLVHVGASPEYNLGNDIHAANVVFDSGVTVWQVPASIYRLVNVSYAELEVRVGPHGPLGRYLVDQLIAWNARWHPRPIESRSLGDSPAIGLMLEPFSGVFRPQTPVRFTAAGDYEPSSKPQRIFVCEQVDTRFLLEDMFAKIARAS